jgi:hypothetical protein
MNNVVSIFKNREKALSRDSYNIYLNNLDMMGLLEEITKFQEERSRVGRLTIDMIKRGIPLWKALHKNAETPELITLSKSYLNNLKYELKVFQARG